MHWRSPQVMSIRTWLRAVHEGNYVLGNIETKTTKTPRAKSRSVLKAKLAAFEMRAHPKDADIEEILDDISRGEQNRNWTEKQYSIHCPSFGLWKCTKTLCVLKNSFDLHPINSDGTINQMSMHWSNHFKGLYYTNKIPHLVLNMADKHLWNLYFHHILKYGGNHFPYFDYDQKNQRLDRIKANASIRKARHARNFTDINFQYKGKKGCG